MQAGAGHWHDPGGDGKPDGYELGTGREYQSAGRWPANAVLDEEAAEMVAAQYADHGGASRFFYVAKASRAERGEGNNHPTVKPIALMQWLVRLVTPPGGTVLDPFTGSGTTGIAALREGFSFIGIEREADYCAIARQRIRDDAPLMNTVSEVAA